MMHAETNIQNESKMKTSERTQMFRKLEMVYRINASTKCGKEACQNRSLNEANAG
jgi:hypothetical protein